jgi:hypothetical protein
MQFSLFFPFTLTCLGSQVMGEAANYLCSVFATLLLSGYVVSGNGRTVVVSSREAIQQD